MKKTYNTPQTFMVCGAYNTQILAGSPSGDSNSSANSTVGQTGANTSGYSGNSGSSSTGSGTSSTLEPPHSKSFNAWETWDE